MVKDCGEGQSMFSAGEQVILQTALIEEIDPGQSKSEITRVLMDTGSQRTGTVGESKLKEIISPTVTVLFKWKKRSAVSIKASLVQEISGNVQQASIETDNQFKIIRKYKLADTLPKHTESSSTEILIGNDYYNEIMSTERIKVHEGSYIIKSIFGWLINGWTKTTEGSKDENVMLIMTHSMNNILPEIYQFTPVEPSLKPASDIDEFLKLETIGIIPPEETKSDDGVMEHFSSTLIQ